MRDYDLILDLINTDAGRYLIGEKSKEKIVRISPNSYHKLIRFKGKRSIFQATFFMDNHIEQIFSPIIEKQRIASDKYLDRILQDKYKSFLHFAGLEKVNYLPQIYLNTLVKNLSAQKGLAIETQSTWADAHNATDAGGDRGGTVVTTKDIFGYNITRYGLSFDTSSLLSTATISLGATDNKVELFIDNLINGGSTSLSLVGFTPANPTSIALADYDQFGITVFSTIALSSLTTSAWNEWDLDANGRANINKTGYSCFGFRNSKDISNTSPGDPESNVVNFEDITNTDKPKLTVTYIYPVSGYKSLLGVGQV